MSVIPEHMQSDVDRLLNLYREMSTKPEIYTAHAWRNIAKQAARMLKDLSETNQQERPPCPSTSRTTTTE